MAQTLINLYDTGGNVYYPVPSDLCREDFDGNLFFHVDGITGDTNLDAFLNHPALVNAVDNMDGTWTFEMDPDLLDSEECITLYEETPTPCVDECPEVGFRQAGVDGDTGLVYAAITINHDDLASVDINGNVYTSNWIAENTAPTGDCVVYDLIITSNTGCVWTFTITLPACPWFGSFDDCSNHNECNVYSPSLTINCNNTTGEITLVPNYDGGAVVSETYEYSCDGITWTVVPGMTFKPPCINGYIRMTLELDDSCGPYEIIEEFVCGLDCENSSECSCVYDAGADTFTINCTDTFASAIATDTLVYYIDGGVIPNAATLGVPIPATGITRIDWERTVEFTDSCPDLILTGDCAKIDDCAYDGYSLDCTFDPVTMSSMPVATGDTSILNTNLLSYAVDGGNFTPYLGGAVHVNFFVAWKWEIKAEGCDKEVLVSTCGHCDKCDDINVNITNENPISVTIDGCIETKPCEDEIIACQTACWRSQDGVTQVDEIYLQNGIPISSLGGGVPAWTFPYTAPYATLITHLNTWLAANGGGTAEGVQIGTDFCLSIKNSIHNFAQVQAGSIYGIFENSTDSCIFGTEWSGVTNTADGFETTQVVDNGTYWSYLITNTNANQADLEAIRDCVCAPGKLIVMNHINTVSTLTDQTDVFPSDNVQNCVVADAGGGVSQLTFDVLKTPEVENYCCEDELNTLVDQVADLGTPYALTAPWPPQITALGSTRRYVDAYCIDFEADCCTDSEFATGD